MSKQDIPAEDKARCLEVLKHLDDLVDEFGEDHLYQHHAPATYSDGTCWYVANGEPDCIAAQVFVRMGATIEQLSANEGDSANNFAMKVLHWGYYAAILLRTAQIAQDNDRPWGAARDEAKNWAASWGLFDEIGEPNAA